MTSSSRATPPRAPRSTAAAFALPGEACALLWRERSLWRWAAAPFLLSLAAFFGAVVLLGTWGGELRAFATDWIPDPSADAWYQWLWVAPADLVLWLFGTLLFLALCAGVVIGAWLVAGVLAAPFHDELSKAVERVVTGGVEDVSRPGVSGVMIEAGRSIVEEGRRMIFFLGVQGTILLLGFVIPGGQIVAPPAMTLFTIFFLPLDYTSYTLDRRHVTFPQKRRWAARHRPAMLGFGAAAFVTFLIPGLNFLAMPVLVVAGTLLALRLPQPEVSEAR